MKRRPASLSTGKETNVKPFRFGEQFKKKLTSVFGPKGKHGADRHSVFSSDESGSREDGNRHGLEGGGLFSFLHMRGGRHSRGRVFEGVLTFLGAVKNYFVSINWPLLLLSVIASVYGLLMIRSTHMTSLTVQIVSLILGLVAYFLIAMFDISHLAVFWRVVMGVGVAFLLSILVFGRSAGGNSGWIRIPMGSLNVGIQPGEVVKIFLIITLAKRLDMLGNDITRFKGVVIALVHFGIYAAALVFSKDDGMLLTYVFLFVAMIFAAGVKLRYLAFGAGALVLATPLIWNYLLDYYQKMRILVVLDPTLDLEDKGYHGYISKVAISNGGLTGMGYGKGAVTQFSNPGNLPAKHTDFIFSVICEEMGFFGALAAIGILIGIVVICLLVARKVRHDKFSYLLAVGVASMLIFQTFLNVGMCLGVVPVIGLTLPFFSHGGSSILTMFISVGMVASVGAHVRPRTLSDIY